MDGEEGFVAALFKIEPALLSGGMDLGVLAGDLLGSKGETGGLAEVADHV